MANLRDATKTATKPAMKTKLTLKNPLWETTQRRQILEKVLNLSAQELEKAVKDRIENSVPTGRLYRRGAITARATKKTANLGLFRKAGTKTRVIIGSRFHRASASGQAPAIDSGKLLRSLQVKKTGVLQLTIFTPLKYAAILENKLNRPFLKVSRDNYRRKFKQNLKDAIIQTIKS